jgi:protein-arginine kinase activator protein McsA
VDDLVKLRQQLKDAVAAEDYETAATLRDAITEQERGAYKLEKQ